MRKILLCLLFVAGCADGGGFRPPDVRYEPTAMDVVQTMLELGAIGREDVVADLGCGDGRIVIEAARRYGARGVGVDLDPARIAESEANARAAGVGDLVRFVRADAGEVDLAEADVVTLWTLPTLNLRLRAKLRRELRPGARVVGHSFDMADWAPSQTDLVAADAGTTVVYRWTIGPAAGTPAPLPGPTTAAAPIGVMASPEP